MITIGITCSYHEENLTDAERHRLERYSLALQDADAVAKVLFMPDAESDLQEIAANWNRNLEGLILGGGDDLPPEMWGDKPHPNMGDLVSPLRPALEKELLQLMLAEKKAILGICYGAQLLNVLEGGSLIQDISTQCPDALEHRGGARHFVRTEPDSLLRKILGENFEVASYHHQSIDKLAPTAKLAATAKDNIIEAVEFPQYRFCVGVQWHPECWRESDTTQQLMKTFVGACR